MTTEKVLEEVNKERIRQDRIWGVQDHSAPFWLTILLEEVGEVARAILEMDYENLREELVQVSAVAVAMVEAYDRGTMELRYPDITVLLRGALSAGVSKEAAIILEEALQKVKALKQ